MPQLQTVLGNCLLPTLSTSAIHFKLQWKAECFVLLIKTESEQS